jgi:hypothetical protein
MPCVRSCGISQNVGVKVEKNSKEIETEIAENCLVYYIASCPPISRQLLPPREGRTTYGEGVGRGAAEDRQGRGVNLLTDLKEERDGVVWHNSWVVAPVTKIVAEFSESLKKYPPIKLGTPAPYSPPR